MCQVACNIVHCTVNLLVLIVSKDYITIAVEPAFLS